MGRGICQNCQRLPECLFASPEHGFAGRIGSLAKASSREQALMAADSECDGRFVRPNLRCEVRLVTLGSKRGRLVLLGSGRD